MQTFGYHGIKRLKYVIIANICSRCLKQTTFSDAVFFAGTLRDK